MDTFGSRLKTKREETGFTQQQLADLMGKGNKTVISSWEKDKNEPSLADIKKLSLHLKTSINYLITSDEQTAVNDKSLTVAYYGDIDVTAGPDLLFTDGSVKPTDYIHIPSFEDCDVSFPLWGDSMWPAYQSGQIILCKEYFAWRDYVPFGEVFLIVTDSLRTVKYVKKAGDAENLLLVSENQHYEPFELPKKHIKRMFLVKGAIKRNIV